MDKKKEKHTTFAEPTRVMTKSYPSGKQSDTSDILKKLQQSQETEGYMRKSVEDQYWGVKPKLGQEIYEPMR